MFRVSIPSEKKKKSVVASCDIPNSLVLPHLHIIKIFIIGLVQAGACRKNHGFRLAVIQ